MVATVLDVVEPAQFEREVIEGSRHRVVVVDFWAPWCQPCKVLGPVLERFAEQDVGRWLLARIDVQQHPELSAPYEVTGIPAVFGFRDGRVVDQFVGSLPPPQVRAWLDRLSPPPADLAVFAAEQTADPTAKAARFREALALQADHPRALLGLAELEPDRAEALVAALPVALPPDLAARRARLVARIESRGADGSALAAAVAANPTDLDARWRLAHVHAAAGDLDHACAELLEIVRRDRKYRDDGARKAMLALFDLADPHAPLIQIWRKRLSMELFK